MTKRIATLFGALASFALSTQAQIAPGPGLGAQTARFPVPKAPSAEARANSAAEEYFFDTKLDHFDADGESSSF